MEARCEVGSQREATRNWQSALAARQAIQLNQIAAKWRTQLAKLCRAPLPSPLLSPDHLLLSLYGAQFQPLPGWLPLNGLWGKYFKCADFWHVLVAVHVLNCCHRVSLKMGQHPKHGG